MRRALALFSLASILGCAPNSVVEWTPDNPLHCLIALNEYTILAERLDESDLAENLKVRRLWYALKIDSAGLDIYKDPKFHSLQQQFREAGKLRGDLAAQCTDRQDKDFTFLEWQQSI